MISMTTSMEDAQATKKKPRGQLGLTVERTVLEKPVTSHTFMTE